MNKRQKKKAFRKDVYVMPQGRRTKAGICPKCNTNSDMWISRRCPNCGYIGIPINDE